MPRDVYVAGLSQEEVRRRYGLRRVVKLASNENNWGLPWALRWRILLASAGLHRYPDASYRGLKEALGRRHGLPPERVVVGNGSDEVLEILLTRLTRPGDAVVVPRPSFQYYRILCANHGRRCVEVPLRRDWSYDLDAMAAAVRRHRAAMAVLCNPNNPTGSWIRRAELAAFLRAVGRRTFVVVDEAYAEFAVDPEFGHGRGLLDGHPNLAVCRTFSKHYAMAGLRLGYALVSERTAGLYERFRPPFSVNGLAAAVAPWVLEHPEPFERRRRRILAEKRRLHEALLAMGVESVPTEGNFLFLPSLRDGRAVYEGLLRRGVVVRELSAFGLPGGLRVTVGRPEENRTFLRELRRLLRVHGT